MQSKTSFFNKTVFKKNLTRFAPVMALYTLCLILGMVTLYQNDRNLVGKNFWFASRMAECIQIMGVVNLFFAPLMAMLLFGDLFTSRMCNALHAMPLRRESFFLTNIFSGLVFSLIPTAVMALLSMPLLAGTCVHNAWQIAILWFIGANLEFITFFGIAVLCVFCTGSRFAMAVVYGALNAGAFIVYFIIDAIYTPMLYGVVTPDTWAERLTPIAFMMNESFVEVQNFNELSRLFKGRESEMVANYWVNEKFGGLAIWALVGVALLVIALLLYRRRNLECAGDAIAIPVLRPVFQVACAIGAAAFSVMALEMFFGIYTYNDKPVLLYSFLGCGLLVGWFAGKMFLERSTRVFQLKNWVGLGILAAVAVVSLTATHFDILGIETRIPKVENVESVTLWMGGSEIKLTEETDIRQMIRLQEMALEDRLEQSGAFPLSYIQSRKDGIEGVTMPAEGFLYGEDGYDPEEEHLYAAPVNLIYELKNGGTMTRSYYIWASLEEGDIVNQYMSRWDVVWEYARRGWEDPFDIQQVYSIRVTGNKMPEEMVTPQVAQSLMDAIKADCEAGTMNQSSYFHDGYFRFVDEDDGQSYNTRSLYISIYTGSDEYSTGANFDIFADSENTLKWLADHDLLTGYELCQGNHFE